MWEYRGQKRPPFADQPAANQESVWDYPRPPLVQACRRLIEVSCDDRLLARSRSACRVLETASPPGFYIPPEDVDKSLLVRAAGLSVCEWKGSAQYWSLSSDPTGMPVAWSYENPIADFRSLRGHLSFYPGRIDCRVDGERVRPQPGSFYGGWITNDLAGPFKGEPGTGHW